MNLDEFYGVKVLRHEPVVRLVWTEPTWQDKLRGWLGELRFMVTQALLFAGSVTAFAWGFGAFHG